MTNGYRSAEAVSPLSDAARNSYLCLSTRTDRPCCCQLIWQTLPLVNAQERRGKCSLAMKMLIREFIQSPWVWLGLTQKAFGERLLSLGSEESGPNLRRISKGFSEKSLHGYYGLAVPCVLYSREYSMPPPSYIVVLIFFQGSLQSQRFALFLTFLIWEMEIIFSFCTD